MSRGCSLPLSWPRFIAGYVCTSRTWPGAPGRGGARGCTRDRALAGLAATLVHQLLPHHRRRRRRRRRRSAPRLPAFAEPSRELLPSLEVFGSPRRRVAVPPHECNAGATQMRRDARARRAVRRAYTNVYTYIHTYIYIYTFTQTAHTRVSCDGGKRRCYTAVDSKTRGTRGGSLGDAARLRREYDSFTPLGENPITATYTARDRRPIGLDFPLPSAEVHRRDVPHQGSAQVDDDALGEEAAERLRKRQRRMIDRRAHDNCRELHSARATRDYAPGDAPGRPRPPISRELHDSRIPESARKASFLARGIRAAIKAPRSILRARTRLMDYLHSPRTRAAMKSRSQLHAKFLRGKKPARGLNDAADRLSIT